MRSLHALILSTAISLAVASVAACSSTTTEPGNQAADSGAGSDAGKVDPDAGSSDAASNTTLLAPTITMVMPMTGGLHVMWTNKQADCDAIEGERKSAAEAYKVAFTVPDGTVDNNHDGPLTAGTAYTYRLRCKKGSGYSPYSNEKSGTP